MYEFHMASDGVIRVNYTAAYAAAHPPEAASASAAAQSAGDKDKAAAADDDDKAGSASASRDGPGVFPVRSVQEFAHDMEQILRTISSGPVKSLTHNRLHIIESRFKLHNLLNLECEQRLCRSVPHRDFYNVRKVDNHIHHSACMTQKHLLRFIKHKVKQNLPEKVIVRNNKELTLAEVMASLNMSAYDLNVDTLDMHAESTFHRFDRFNNKYNPVGESRLREIFLKFNNFIKGKYLAEITSQVCDDLEANKYQYVEWRVSIYGTKQSEWSDLAAWVVDNNLFRPNVRWMVQIPRLFSVYRQSGILNNFQEMLTNIFAPLFRVTLDPASDPKLHMFLQHMVGVDSVDDESVREPTFNVQYHSNPATWDKAENPPYAMFAYYMYANLGVLNKLRDSLGMCTFAYRPHAGEAGDVEHCVSTFLLANSINHGINLFKSPSLQYLYYLTQIGISISPLSNNLLFLEYNKNPFPRFFARGLNVALSTDDPLMIHVTKEPLVEEYSVAAQVWKLSPIDMCEIARNSVLQSGYDHLSKAHWLGNHYWKRSTAGNDIRCTNVPNVRILFRLELLQEELVFLARHAAGAAALAEGKVSDEAFDSLIAQITDPL